MQLVQSTTARVLYQAASTATATLPAAPAVGHLLVAAVGIDKDMGTTTPTVSTGWTRAAAYRDASVSQIVAYRVADGTAADRSCTFTWATPQGAQAMIGETDLGQSPALASAVTQPNPASDSTVSSVTADAGAATATGEAIAFHSVDTADTGQSTAWTNGYTVLRADVGDSNTADTAFNGGATIVVAGKDLASATTTSTTVSWSPAKTDQMCLTVLRFTGSTAVPVGLQPPTGLTVTSVSASELDLSWTGASGATSYDIERNGTVAVTAHAGTSYADTGLTAATTYTYRVRSRA